MRTHGGLNLSRAIGGRALLTLMVLTAAAPLYAVDGVIEINQAKVEAGGGFPFVINQPGSYRLTGNLTVDQNTSAIQITADNVTVDLNGFAIIGPTVCSGTPVTCIPDITPGQTGGGGVVANPANTNITVLNGTVRGMGALGVGVGGHSRVEGVHAISNRSGGIGTSFSSVVTGNVANSNGGAGIGVNSGCTVTSNTVNNNGGVGISAVAGSTVIGNTARGNVAVGLNFIGIGGASGYATNVLGANNGGGAQVSGGVQMGPNICGAALCP